MDQNYFSNVSIAEMQAAFTGVLFSKTLDQVNSGVQLLKPVFDSNKNIIDFEIVYLNEAARLFAGKNHDENIAALVRSHTGNFFEKELLPVLNEGIFFNKNYSLGGETGVLSYIITLLSDGILLTHDKVAISLQAAIGTDITVEQSQLLHSLANSIPDILFIMNLYTKDVLFINRSMQKLLGYSDAHIDAMPEPFFDVIYPDDLPMVLQHLEEMKNAQLNEVREITYRMVAITGQLHWFRDRNTVFKTDAQGRAIEKTGVLRDISVEKNAEAKINELNKTLSLKNSALESINSEMKTLNGIAANDYKETLQKLYTNLEFILTTDARNLSDAGRGNLRKMQASIQKMKLLTDDIISFFKLQTLDEVLADVDLNQIIRITQNDLADKAAESGVEIISENLPHIQGYPLLLSLLFYHLLDNAIKFRHEEKAPQIKILCAETEAEPLNGLKIVYHCVSVIDDGIGFDKDESEKLFSMFYRAEGKRKYKGSGIGLSVCKKIMSLHNGYIVAESTEGGAAFHCYFPR